MVPIYQCHLLAAARGDDKAIAEVIDRCARAIREEAFRYFPCAHGALRVEGGFKGRCEELSEAQWAIVADLSESAWTVVTAIRLRAAIDGGAGFYAPKK